MPNIDEGAVLGGRYEITGRVMSSAQDDQVLTGLDQVLNREVLILVAAPQNASQAAQSARQLATGERASSIQILDLGLSENRTYLVAPGNAEVEDFLALLTSREVYVEPFFTELLGTELFGESREHTPEKFEDDDEYYADLQGDLAEDKVDAENRPEFLNKISERIDNWLQEDNRGAAVVPGATSPASPTAPAPGAAPQPPEQVPPSERPSPESASEPAQESNANADYQGREQPTEMVPPITEEHAQTPAPVPPAAVEKLEQVEVQEPAEQQRAAFIPPPVAPTQAETSPNEGYAIEYTEERTRSTFGRWLAGLLLIGVLVVAVVLGFRFLGDAGEQEQPPVASEPTEEQGSNETDPQPEAQPSGPEPVPASVQRVVPDSPTLSDNYEADLPTLIDGNQATAWHTLSFSSPQFGGYASNLALVVELEEQAPVSELTITQNQGSGGAFSVSVSNEPEIGSGVMVTEGSFTGPEYTVDVKGEDGEPIAGRYVIINFTELPTLTNTNSPNLPYGLRIAEIDVQ